MLHGHFEALRPVCPHCRRQGRAVALALAVVEAEKDDDVVSGILLCGACGAEYPIIDGLPVLVADVAGYIRDNLFYLLARDDLGQAAESLVGDAAGPGTAFDSARQHLSSYVWDHWAEFDPLEEDPAPGGARPGAVARGLAEVLALAGPKLPAGPVLDFGCAAGRTVHELAAATGRRVLGIDLSASLARAGRRAVLEGAIDYARRRIGLVYDRRRFAIPETPRAMADIWICDAAALPFAEGTFALALGMNVLDCLASPRDGLVEIDRVLTPDGEAALTVPFDWTAAVTPAQNWIGGHSQRGPHRGSAEEILDLLLQDGPLAAGKLRRKPRAVEIPWHVRLHERACMHYHAYGLAAKSG